MAEAHNPEARVRFFFLLIAGTHIQEANRSVSTKIAPSCFQLMRVSDEQQVIGLSRCRVDPRT
jgi:hypothetical protein